MGETLLFPVRNFPPNWLKILQKDTTFLLYNVQKQNLISIFKNTFHLRGKLPFSDYVPRLGFSRLNARNNSSALEEGPKRVIWETENKSAPCWPFKPVFFLEHVFSCLSLFLCLLFPNVEKSVFFPEYILPLLLSSDIFLSMLYSIENHLASFKRNLQKIYFLPRLHSHLTLP